MCIAVFQAYVFAGPGAPPLLNYQGQLNDDSGNPVNTEKIMSFKIYPSSDSTTALWTSGNINVRVVNGVFNVTLGETPQPALSADLFSDDSRYIGVTVDGSEFSARKRLVSVPYALNASGGGIPSGGIIMWSGAVDNIPDGWALCDGTNNTPDLRNRFVVGAGSNYWVGRKGGRDQNTLASKNNGSHQHKTSWGFGDTEIYGWADASGAPIFGSYVVQPANGKRWNQGNNDGGAMRLSLTEGSGDHNHQIYETSTPSSSILENRPPYYALCFIMKL